jgi:sigma-B regulation protein RsbQ
MVGPLRVALVAALSIATQDLPQTPSHYVNVAGIRVHYTTYGRGNRGLVFVHGSNCDLGFWRFQSPFFDGSRRVVLLDLPGHGRSDKPAVTYTADLFASAVHQVMIDAGLDAAVLVGHSMGAIVALQTFRRWPGSVVSLVSVDGLLPNAMPPQQRAEALAKGADTYRGADYVNRLATWMDPMFGPDTPSSVRDEARSHMLASPQHVMVGMTVGLGDPAVWKADRVDVPVMAIFADGWRTLPKETTHAVFSSERERFLRSFIPGLRYEVWERAGHFLMMERPDDFNRLLQDFLRTIRL